MLRLLLALVLALLGLWPASTQAAPGDLDSGFGLAGVVRTEAGRDDYVHDVAVDAAGRTVVAGSAESFSVDRASIAVARYTRAGSPDPAFGGGDGLVVLNLGSHLLDFAKAVAVDRNGRILLAGLSCADDTYAECFAAVVRLRGDGQLDPYFGDGDGVASAPADGVADLAIDASGRIVLTGDLGGRLAVLRLTQDGAPDPSFSGDGVATVDLGGSYGYGHDVGLDSQGRIVAAGEVGGEGEADFGVARFLPGGGLDSGFSGDGSVVTDLESLGNLDYPSGMVIDPQDRIDMVGTSLPASPGDPWHPALARYTAGGSLDPTFGAAGVVFGEADTAGMDLAIDASERLLVAESGEENVLLRYQPGGGLDPSFGGGDGSAPASLDIVESLTVDPWRRVVLGGSEWNGSDSDLAAARFLSGEPLPPSRTLSVTVNGIGRVTGPGIDCPGDCTETFASGTPVSLIAGPGPGSAFGGWSGDCAGPAVCDLVLDRDAAATATFAAQASSAPAAPAAAPPPAVAPPPRAVARCRKGFKMRKVHGKRRCIRRKRPPHHRSGR